ncbi:MAG: ATP-binding cassette domain-containing protein, partial [Clostridia bacterium]|nr:ATP-binding cassette domain-containing protein [Clostridia bacterium]
MAVIKVENLTFSYPSAYCNVFENVSFQIDTDWKLGFVGRNGRGKTTFLNLLQGKYEYGGKIISPVKFDYFPPAVGDGSALTQDVLSGVCPSAEEWQIMRELSLLEVDGGVLYRPFNTLSNGEQTKVLLAALFLGEGRFLLIDEPTNHLDAKAREAVSAYLRKKEGFILVSHDRDFLDGCVDHILSLNRTDIEVQSGNFSSFMENFRRRQEFERARSERLKKDIVRFNEAARRTSVWADKVEASKTGALDKGYVGHKSAKMMKRAKAVEARRQKAADEKSELLKNTEVDSGLKITPLVFRAERLACLSAVAPIYGGNEVCAPVSFTVNRGERIALNGRNGSGKSSLLKLLCGQNLSYSGKLETGNGLIVSYVPQDASSLTGTLAGFAAAHGIDESLFKAVLHKMGFDKGQFGSDLAGFSDGQKKKTLLEVSFFSRANLYICYDPLNYID